PRTALEVLRARVARRVAGRIERHAFADGAVSAAAFRACRAGLVVADALGRAARAAVAHEGAAILRTRAGAARHTAHADHLRADLRPRIAVSPAALGVARAGVADQFQRACAEAATCPGAGAAVARAAGAAAARSS